MNCKVCGSNGWINSVLFKKPDKYEEWVGIKDVRRRWRRCLGCGLWHHWRNYPLEDLEKIYSDGYRNPEFRGETIRQALMNVFLLPDTKSENSKRVDWFLKSIGQPETMLDIGSGLGVFPLKLRENSIDVECVEQNNDSIELLSYLNLPCTKEIPDKKYDVISLVHVLEHIEEPVENLKILHRHLKPEGRLFVEVPDAVEFEILYPTHDDFNSCHTHFYDIPSLCRTFHRAEFNVIDIHREHYEERNLYRIMATCKKM